MGYRGKVNEQLRARELRAGGMTVPDIAAELGVSRSSVSLWVRDVPFVPGPRRLRPRGPNRLQRAKEAEIAALIAEGRDRIGRLTDKEFLVAGAALYAGEGAKGDRAVRFANTDPRMVLFFLSWLRRFFAPDERRLRMRLYLHEGLDLEAAVSFWSSLTGIPCHQFEKPYRAVSRGGVRHNKHEFGCPSVAYSCSRTHRAIMGLVAALLACETSIPG